MSITRTPRDRTNAHDMGPDPYAETVAREFAGSFPNLASRSSSTDVSRTCPESRPYRP